MDWDIITDWRDFDWKMQEKLLNCTVRSTLYNSCPPSHLYTKSFLRFIINQLESAGNVEICDTLYEEYAKLQASSTESDTCYKTYRINDTCSVTLLENIQLVTKGTTGLRTWQAAQYLAEWALAHRDLFQSKHILELGSGVGFTGLVVCSVCKPASYTFSDYHSSVLNSMAANIHRNTPVTTDTKTNSNHHTPATADTVTNSNHLTSNRCLYSRVPHTGT